MNDPFFLLTVALLVMMGFTIWKQRKRAKEIEEMRNSITVGDTVTTIGGIIGEVTEIREDYLVIMTEEHSIKFKKWSINSRNKREEVSEVENENN